MKVLTIPSSGKLANTVAYISPFGQVFRTRVVPRNTPSAVREHMRGSFGSVAQMWGRRLSPEQRDRWNYAGPQVMSHPRLGRGPLSGQQHFQGINSARACIGLGPLFEPPGRVVFGPSPVGELVITIDDDVAPRSPGAGEAERPKPSNGTQWVVNSHPERLATPGSEFCGVASDGGPKRKQRVLKLCDRAPKVIWSLRPSLSS